jgi:hypothetical protein
LRREHPEGKDGDGKIRLKYIRKKWLRAAPAASESVSYCQSCPCYSSLEKKQTVEECHSDDNKFRKRERERIKMRK